MMRGLKYRTGTKYIVGVLKYRKDEKIGRTCLTALERGEGFVENRQAKRPIPSTQAPVSKSNEYQ